MIRQRREWSRIRYLEADFNYTQQAIFQFSGENGWDWHGWLLVWKKTQLAPYYIAYTQICNPSGIYFNVKHKTIKILE